MVVSLRNPAIADCHHGLHHDRSEGTILLKNVILWSVTDEYWSANNINNVYRHISLRQHKKFLSRHSLALIHLQ